MRRGTEWGYAGKSNHLALRRACHEGRCTRHAACAPGKPWADLIVSYRALRLPWWLGWQWVTLSIETILITILRPRYNWQKNPRRNKVPQRVQVMQRAARDRARLHGREVPEYRFTRTLVPLILMAFTLIGIVGYSALH